MVNTPGQVIKYFGSNTTKHLTFTEAVEFWESLSFEDKWYFEYVNLQTGMLPVEICPFDRGAPIHIEKACSVCCRITWDSKSGGYGETHPDPEPDGVGRVHCNIDGIQYWQYKDGTLEVHDKDGFWIKEVQ